LNQRKTALVLMCLFVVTLVPVGDVDAWWKGVGEMSGPGPYAGFDLIFPWSLSHPQLTLLRVWGNEELLSELLGKPVPKQSLTVTLFLENEEQMHFYGVALDDEYLSTAKKGVEVSVFVDHFLDNLLPGMSLALEQAGVRWQTTEAGRGFVLGDEEKIAQILFEVLNARVWQQESALLRAKIRNFGSGWIGLFGSASSLPKLPDPVTGKNILSDFFFTLGTGYAASLKNGIDYAPGVSDTVHWVTIYPALEWRFGRNQPNRKKAYVKSNWFWNVGPTFHYFFGEGFDNFTRVSLRTRAGRRYKGVYFGAELDYFIPVISHADFGAVGDPREVRFSYGAFIAFELKRAVGK